MNHEPTTCGTDAAPDVRAARAAKDRVRALLAGCDTAGGVGIARRGDGYAVRVTLRRPPAPGTLPDAVDGVPVETRISPPAVALGG